MNQNFIPQAFAITKEQWELLKKEKNPSGLIRKLLDKHYKQGKK